MKKLFTNKRKKSRLNFKHKLSAAFLAIIIIIAGGFLATRFVLSADGSGTNTVSPTSAAAGSTGNTFAFTFTAAETMDSGEISITAPAGFSAPQGISGTAGYTVASSASGIVANVEDNADSTTGWSAGAACASGLTADIVVKQEGTASIACANSNEAKGDQWYKNISTENWSGYTKVAFWVRTNMSIGANQLRFQYDDSANLASPLESLALPALTANTWTYAVLTFGATTRTSILSFGLEINHASALDNATVYIDDILLGPGVPTFPGGGDVRARLLQLAATQTVDITYGSGGGASGVTVPTATSSYTFTTKSRISDAGILANISASPTITINAAITSQFTLNDPGNITTGTRAAYTVTRKDAFNNLVTSGSETVYLYSSSTGVNKKFFDAASGGNIITFVTISDGQSSANFWHYDELAGTFTITVSDNASAPDGTAGIDDGTDAITVSAAAITPTKFVILNPTDSVAGTAVLVTIQAQDNNGDVATTYQNDVTLVTSGSATGGGLVDIVNGVGTKSINDTVAETVNLSLSDTEGTGLNVSSTQDVIFSAGESSQFTLNDSGNTTVGTRLGYTVTRKDQFGNAVTSGTANVYLYSSSTGTAASFYNAASGGVIITLVAINGGQSTANFWYYDELAGTFTITASDSATAPDGATGIADGTDSVTVSAAATSQFTLNNPGNITAGTRAAYTVTRKDAFNNAVTSGSDTVYLYSSSTGANKKFFDAASGGNIITSVTISDGSSSANFWYYDELVGTFTITVSDNASAPDGTAGIDDGTDAITVSAGAPVAEPTPASLAGISALIKLESEEEIAIIFSGLAFPGGKVIVSARGPLGDLPIIQSIDLPADGSFKLEFKGAPPLSGVTSYALLMKDKDGRPTPTKFYNIKAGEGIIEQKIFAPPTISLSRSILTKKDSLIISGYATPGSRVQAEIDGALRPGDISVSGSGAYQINLAVSALNLGSHNVRVRQVNAAGLTSDFSFLKAFTVGEAVAIKTDLNNDGRADISDWSIFLFNWSVRTTASALAIADLNGDGRIDISDFSIILRALRK